MLWVADAKNALIIGSDWTKITGQPASEAGGLGWLSMVHPEDREIVRAIYIQASARRAPYWQRYRLLKKDGGFACVNANASPTLSSEDGAFLGYHGTIRVLDCDPLNFTASGEVGAPHTPVSILQDEPLSVIEALADQLLDARATATIAGEKVIVSIIDVALLAIGRRLAQETDTGL